MSAKSITRRGQLKGVLARFWSYVSADDSDIEQIIVRKEKIEEVWQEFNQVQSELEMDEQNDGDELCNYRTEFEDSYFKAVATANKKIQHDQNSVRTISQQGNCLKEESSNKDICKATSFIKLPALNILIFLGSYTEWASFYDIYTSLIYNNDNISDIQKFFHLHSLLVEGAADCIINIETTADNYEIVWTNLITRYNNKKLLVQTHVKTICDLPTIKSKSSMSLRQFSDASNNHLSALKALGQRPDEWGPLLLHIISTKLDVDTIGEWEVKTSRGEMPKVAELLDFLDLRFHILEAVKMAKNLTKTLNIVNENKNVNRKSKFNKNSLAFTTTSEVKCYVCNSPHTIYKCPTFIALTVDNRIKRRPN